MAPAESSDLTLYARELLADGEWHDYQVVVARLATRVPPGRAIRRAESQRRTASRQMHGGREAVPPRKINATVEHQVRIGSRHIAKQVLNRRVFEIDPRGQVPAGEIKRVRLRRGA
jgi:hypothetical protein